MERFATEYAVEEERLTGKEDDQSSIHYPIVYLFIGEKTAEAIEPMMRIHEKKWVNSAGVMYVHIVSEDDSSPVKPAICTGNAAAESGAAHSRISRLVLPVTMEKDSGKSLRKNLYHALSKHDQHLLALNRAFRQISHNIADYGRMYSSFDRIHLSVITRVDDPLNVFIPELTLLARSIFSQAFKSVQMDLYALISEREQASVFGYSSSVGVAFLRELDYMQQADYTFSAPLHVTEDGIAIPVTHHASPLFDLVYILSDKNERGISSLYDMQDNYEMICHISLLKNRKLKDASVDLNMNSYNNTSFKNNLITESGRPGYVSAGFSKVKRPNQSIALTVLYHFFKELSNRMQRDLHWSSADKLAFFGLDPASISTRASSVVPHEERIRDMSGIMTYDHKFANLRTMSLREAEQALFGDGCSVYFHDNFAREMNRAIEQMDPVEHIGSAMEKHKPDSSPVTFFHLYEWTHEMNETEGVLKDLRSTIRNKSRELDHAAAEIEQLYLEKVEDQSFQRMPLMDKHNVRSFIRHFFDKIYRKKLERLELEAELALLRRYETALEQLHSGYKRQVQQMQQLEQTLHEAALESIRQADDYIGQNIMEYYGKVTQSIMQEVESKRGQGIFFEDRYVSSIPELLNQGVEVLTAKLIAVCRQHLLTTEPFKQTFEEELLRRANVTIDYNNTQVLSKDELFKRLYRTLEDHAGIHIRLLDYTHDHRYEEKYFFGDYTSEFIRYALSADESSRIYKLGCVHEKRSSGVEKLNMMGGFHVEDLMYYRNGKMYYDSYVQNGYEFHGVDANLLPELR